MHTKVYKYNVKHIIYCINTKVYKYNVKPVYRKRRASVQSERSVKKTGCVPLLAVQRSPTVQALLAFSRKSAVPVQAPGSKLRLSPTVPPIQLPLYVLFNIFYYPP
jgi:hypothetical protein